MDSRTAPAPTSLAGHALALIAYLAATLGFFASALPQLGNAFPGGAVAGVDGWQHTWHLWWTQRALAAGVSPLHTPLLYHPDGVNLAIHPLNLATGVPLAPLTALAGPVVAFNVALLLGFTLAGYGAFLLARRVGASGGAALVAGLLFTFSPFHATKAYDGQLELVSLQWVVLYAWLLLRAAEQRGLLAPLFAGLALAAVGYTSLYYLVYCAIYSLCFALLWLPLRAKRRALLAYGGRLALVPIVALLCLAPLLVALGGALAQVTGGAEPAAPTAQAGDLLLGRSANLLDFWLPSYLHPLWGSAVARLGPLLHPGISAWNHALGYTALALAAVACARRWAHAWRWLALAGVGLLLALGPELNVGATRTGLPLPYQLLLLVPGMEIAQRPGHLVLLATLALVPLSALGLSWLHARYGQPALVAALLLAAIELAPPAWPTQPFTVHPAYAALAARPGAMLVLPVEIDSSDVLRDQIVHSRPLVGGYLARTPPYPFAELTPGVRQLWQLQPDQATLADPAGGPSAAGLAAYGISDLVVRWERIPPSQRDAARRAIAQVLPGVAPAYEDAGLAVYEVPPATAAPLAYFAAGWYPEERAGERRWRWMGATGELMLLNPSDAPLPVSLSLQAESFGAPRTLALSLNGAPVGSWQVSPQPVAARTRLWLMLPPGPSRLVLATGAAPDPGGRGPISIVVSAISIAPGR